MDKIAKKCKKHAIHDKQINLAKLSILVLYVFQILFVN